MSTTAQNYKVKSTYNNENYRFSTNGIPTLRFLESQISEYFQISSKISLKWIDEEGDQIAMKSNKDVEEAFTDSNSSSNDYNVVRIVTQVVQTSVVNAFSPITTVSGNPITTVPIVTSSLFLLNI